MTRDDILAFRESGHDVLRLFVGQLAAERGAEPVILTLVKIVRAFGPGEVIYLCAEKKRREQYQL